MHVVLALSLVAYTVFFAYLVAKHSQLSLAAAIQSCELQLDDDRDREPSTMGRQFVGGC